MAYLEIVDEQSGGVVLQLTGERFVVGRDDGCDLVLNERHISRRHVILHRRDDGWQLEDLGSTNGATINGQPAVMDLLKDGDLIGIGETQLRFREHPLPAAGMQVLDSGHVAGLVGGQTVLHAGARLRLLLEVAAALDSVGSPEELLARCGQLVVSVFQPACCLLRVGHLSWAYQGGRIIDDGSLPGDMSQTVLSRVGEQGETLLLSDVSNEPDLSRVKSVHMLGIRSAMGTPVLIAGQRLGSLYVDQRRLDKQLREEDLQYLAVLGHLIGAAMASAQQLRRATVESERLRARQGPAGAIVGESQAMARLRRDVAERIAPVNAGVLLLGETGTGKSLVAEAIHLASPRSKGPFVEVNCAAIPSELMESELFGHEKGAFSGATGSKQGHFEVASGGTLFLDEVGELAPAAQAKLLSVLQSHRLQRVGATKPIEVDVRVVAATNRDLAAEVKAGRFRADLYYRLNVVTLEIPPLRRRPEDIPALAQSFLERACRNQGRRVPGISADAMRALQQYEWPGNARELSNCIERAVIFGEDGQPLDAEHLPGEITESAAAPTGLDPLAEKERELIVQAMERAGGNKREAARQLGWYPQKFYSRLKRYDIG